MKSLVIIFLIFISNLTFSNRDPYIGYWKTIDQKFIIEISRDGEIYIGHIRWLKDLKYPSGDPMEGAEQCDRKNPDKNLRNRKVIGMQVVGDLSLSESSKKLTGGWIYDSWNGEKYYGSAKSIDYNTLKLRGSYDKFGIIGYSVKATRVPDLKNVI